MKMAHIKFNNNEDDARGFVELIKRIRVTCLSNDEYEIPEKSMRILDELNIPYDVLDIEGLDHVYGKIRNSVATKV